MEKRPALFERLGRDIFIVAIKPVNSDRPSDFGILENGRLYFDIVIETNSAGIAEKLVLQELVYGNLRGLAKVEFISIRLGSKRTFLSSHEFIDKREIAELYLSDFQNDEGQILAISPRLETLER